MTQNFLADLKTTLENCIAELDELHFMLCQNPEADFTGNRKLSFHDYIQFMVQMQSKSVSNEILDFFEHSLAAPAKSSFTQQHFKDGAFCSIFLWNSAGNFLISPITAIAF